MEGMMRPEHALTAAALVAISLSACIPAAQGPALRDLEAGISSPSSDIAKNAAEDLYTEALARIELAREAKQKGDSVESERQAHMGLIVFNTAVAQARINTARKRWEEAEALRNEAQQDTERYNSMREVAEEQLARSVYLERARKIIEREKARAESEEKHRERFLEKKDTESLDSAKRILAVELVSQTELRMSAAQELLGYHENELTRELVNTADVHLDKARKALNSSDYAEVSDETLEAIAMLERMLSLVRMAGGAGLEKKEESLAVSFDALGLDSRKDGRGLAISLENVFTGTRTRLSRKEKDLVQSVCEVLKPHKDIVIFVEGFAGSPDAPRKSKRLVEPRVGEIKKALLSGGINEDRIKTFPYGPANPLATWDTKEGYRLNNRVELLILYTGER